MDEVLEAEVHGALLRFDGRVLEVFAPVGSGSNRWVIDQLAAAGVEKGLTTLKFTIAFRAVDLKGRIKWDGSQGLSQSWGFDGDQQPAVERLGLALQAAGRERFQARSG